MVAPPEMSLLPSSRPSLTSATCSTARSRASRSASPTPTSSTWSRSSRPTTPSHGSRPTATTGLTPAAYRVTRELLRDKAKSDSIILHSLPRMDELPPDVDGTRHARYWVEAFNGVVLRMALLALVLGAVE